MEKAEHHCEAENLEEGDEDLAAGEAAEHKRKEGGDAAIDDSRPNGSDSRSVSVMVTMHMTYTHI